MQLFTSLHHLAIALVRAGEVAAASRLYVGLRDRQGITAEEVRLELEDALDRLEEDPVPYDIFMAQTKELLTWCETWPNR